MDVYGHINSRGGRISVLAIGFIPTSASLKRGMMTDVEPEMMLPSPPGELESYDARDGGY